MAEARQAAAWEHTSLLASVIANSAPFRKGRAFKPADFNPMAKRSPAAKLRGAAMVEALKGFMKPHGRN